MFILVLERAHNYPPLANNLQRRMWTGFSIDIHTIANYKIYLSFMFIYGDFVQMRYAKIDGVLPIGSDFSSTFLSVLALLEFSSHKY